MSFQSVFQSQSEEQKPERSLKVRIQESQYQTEEDVADTSFIRICQTLVHLIESDPEWAFKTLDEDFPTMSKTISIFCRQSRCSVRTISDYFTLPNGHQDILTVEYLVDAVQNTILPPLPTEFEYDSDLESIIEDPEEYHLRVRVLSVFEDIRMSRRQTIDGEVSVSENSGDEEIEQISSPVKFAVLHNKRDPSSERNCHEQFCLADMEYLPSPPELAVTTSGMKVRILTTASDEAETVAMVKSSSTGITTLRTYQSLFVSQTSYVECLFLHAKSILKQVHDEELATECIEIFRTLVEQPAYIKLVEFLGVQADADIALVSSCVGKIMFNLPQEVDRTLFPVITAAMTDLTKQQEIRQYMNACLDMFSEDSAMPGSYYMPEFSPRLSRTFSHMSLGTVY